MDRSTVRPVLGSANALEAVTMKGSAPRWCSEARTGWNRSRTRSRQASEAVECRTMKPLSMEADNFDFIAVAALATIVRSIS